MLTKIIEESLDINIIGNSITVFMYIMLQSNISHIAVAVWWQQNEIGKEAWKDPKENPVDLKSTTKSKKN